MTAMHEPPVPCHRWTPGRKLWVVDGVLSRKFTVDTASAVYDVPRKEITRWVQRYGAKGVEGLRETPRARRYPPCPQMIETPRERRPRRLPGAVTAEEQFNALVDVAKFVSKPPDPAFHYPVPDGHAPLHSLTTAQVRPLNGRELAELWALDLDIPPLRHRLITHPQGHMIQPGDIVTFARRERWWKRLLAALGLRRRRKMHYFRITAPTEPGPQPYEEMMAERMALMAEMQDASGFERQPMVWSASYTGEEADRWREAGADFNRRHREAFEGAQPIHESPPCTQKP